MFKIKLLLSFCLIIITVCSAFSSEKRFTVPVGDSPVIGPDNASITMIKFVDYQ